MTRDEALTVPMRSLHNKDKLQEAASALELPFTPETANKDLAKLISEFRAKQMIESLDPQPDAGDETREATKAIAETRAADKALDKALRARRADADDLVEQFASGRRPFIASQKHVTSKHTYGVIGLPDGRYLCRPRSYAGPDLVVDDLNADLERRQP